ncbi:MAG TPA: hypothetical protein VL173_09895 [Vicinamibacterales bacterium]|nr:hypothetical protein [Vicinamibacterales bacterium]
MRRRVDPAAAVLAAAAFLWHVLLMTTAANDNFMHMAMAQQWLAGDWPVRDFFDNGRLLQYALSALAQATIGDRLLGEAIVVGLAWAISTYVIFVLVRRLTCSQPAAFLASLLLIVAGARGYSYPKGIVYAVAAMLWWSYVRRPAMATIVGFGAWVAVAYYWRPDHGVYTAFGLVLAAIAAHGVRRDTVVRVVVAGGTAFVLVLPFWIYIQATVGFEHYARASMSALESEHESHGTHVWPILRFGTNIVATEPADGYAPVIGIRWNAASTPAARQTIRQRYGLTTIEQNGDSERVRLSAPSLSRIPAILRESIIDDTAGIDRSTGTLDPTHWPMLQRMKFEHALLRTEVLPQLDERERATEFTVALFMLLPIVLLIASRWIAPRLAPGVTPEQLSAFAVFAFVVAFAMLREPFTARAADAVVLCAVVFALCLVWLWRLSGDGVHRRVIASRTAAVVLAAITTINVAASGRFGPIMDSLTRHWTRNPISGAWSTIHPELTISPPLANYLDRPARVSLRLAAYARACIPPTERVLVLWFEPEIPYFSERLIAQQHFVFPPAWADLAHEQDATIRKVSRYKPPIAFALASDTNAHTAYPGLIDYVQREYGVAAMVKDGGEDYLILTRKDRPAIASFGRQAWPCFVRDPSPWDRVGVPASQP